MSCLRRLWSRYPSYFARSRDSLKSPNFTNFKNSCVVLAAGFSRFSRSYRTADLWSSYGRSNTTFKSMGAPLNSNQTKKSFHDHMENIKDKSTPAHTDRDTSPSLEDQKSDSLQQENKKSKKFGSYEYEFDDNGYLYVDDLVQFLQREAAFDICVIKTTGVQTAYVDYFVVVSGVSNRHISAMSKNLELLFRGQDVRGVGKDGHVTVEGLSTDNWQALDIGNMAVHFFLPETRAVYELEKLWTLGPKYDDQYKALLEEEVFLKAVFVGEERESQDEGWKELDELPVDT